MDNRERILGAAQRALILDPAVSMGAIAECAGVSRATMHRHFASREALLVELGTRSLDQWESRLDDHYLAIAEASASADEIRDALVSLLLGYVEDFYAFGFALTDHVILANVDLVERTEQLAEREARLFAAAQIAGVLRSDVPPRWLGYTVYGQLMAAREALRLGHVAQREVSRLVLSTLLDGVALP